MLTADALPNDIEALKALVLAHALHEQQIQATVQQLELTIVLFARESSNRGSWGKARLDKALLELQ